MTLTKESLILISICVADLVSTILLLDARLVFEGNPIMAYYLSYGIGVFIMVKLTLIALPLFIVEWSRQYRPKFVRAMLRATIVVYVAAYLIVFLFANTGLLHTPHHGIELSQVVW